LFTGSGKAPKHEFEILDLGPNGKPLPPSRVVPASEFNYSFLDRLELPHLDLTLGTSLHEKNASIIEAYGCS
jgi:hypothetical protein